MLVRLWVLLCDFGLFLQCATVVSFRIGIEERGLLICNFYRSSFI